MKANNGAAAPRPGFTRRTVAKGTAGAALAGIAAAGGSATAIAQSKRRTFVLIHGSWHGGWCWKYVTDILEAKGHKVYAPSLTGLADRSHLLSMSVNLETHITDIVNLFKWEDIKDAVLVGHSYAGWPMSGAVEKVLPQVSSIVFVDAFMPENGERLLDITPERFRQPLLDAIAKGQPGRAVPTAESFKIVDKRNIDWVNAMMTPQPAAIAVQPIVLTGARDKVAKKTYIRAIDYPQPTFDKHLAKCKADNTWRTFEFKGSEAGHDIMVDAPQRLAEILMQVA